MGSGAAPSLKPPGHLGRKQETNECDYLKSNNVRKYSHYTNILTSDKDQVDRVISTG